MSEQPHDASPHLDLDALADALAGVAEGADAEDRNARHLTACASCASRLAELRAADARVVAALGALPAPPVPADLGDRLTAALAAEPPLTAPSRGGAPGSAGVTALPERRPQRRAWLPAVAAGVLLVSAGGLGLSLLSGGDGLGGGDSAETAASGTDRSTGGAAALPQSSTGTDYADAAALARVLPDVLAGGAGSAGTTAMRSEVQPGPASESGPMQDGAVQDGAVQDGPAIAAAPADPLARLRTPEGLQDCLAALLPPDEPDVQPLALDYASYAGQPALAVVLPDPDPAQLSVFVVGAGCTRANDSTLYFVRVARP